MSLSSSQAEESNEAAVSTLLAHLPRTAKPEHFQEIIPKFSSQLKSDFENRNLWLRFGLTISLSKESPQSALQAFNECMRIDQDDPLPAMLAAKIFLEDLDDPERALIAANEAIKRCKRLGDQIALRDLQPIDNDGPHENGHESDAISSDTVIKANKRCYYKNIAPILSRSYVLASVAHAYMYEREPESIKKPFKEADLKASLDLLAKAADTNPDDYLVFFHRALHEVKQRTYPKAIDNLRRAIQINPQHLPSMQLLILSLSALKLHEDALTLCESVLDEHEDDLLLLYIKCNLEQNLVETKGYKVALETAQQMLKRIRQSTNNFSEHRNYSSTTTISATTQQTAIHNGQHHNQSSLNTTSAYSTGPSATMSTTSTLPTTTNTVPTSIAGSTLATNSVGSSAFPHTNATMPHSLSNPAGDAKQKSNLFAQGVLNSHQRQGFLCDGELSVWILVAEIFVKIGAVEDAEMCVDEGSMHANGALSHELMFIRGLIAKAKNHLMEAKTFFQSCLALCPRHAKALQQIAHVYYLMGNYPTAEKFLMDSLDLDCDCHKTWYYLSLVYIEMNQHDRASECVKKSTCLEDSSPVVTFSTIPRLTLK